MKDPEINCERIVLLQHVPNLLLLYLFMSSFVSKGKRLWSNMTQNILPSLFCSSSVRCVCMTPRRLREGRCWRLGLESTRSQRSLFLPARAQWSWATLTGSSPSLTSGKVSSRWMLRLFFLLGRFGSAQKRLFWTEAPLLRVFCPGSVCVPSIKDVFGQPFSFMHCDIIELLRVLFRLTLFSSLSACRACAWVS